MLLKGGILKDWYPRPGMREMADCDILIDPAKREETRQLFLDRGYKVMANTGPVHDVYQKPPVFDFEMHHALFAQSQERLRGYFGDVKSRLLPVEGTACQLQFTAEDLYVYLVAHAYKHFQKGGTGLRTLADIYIARRHLDPVADWNQIREDLERAGLGDYERGSTALAKRLFAVPHLPVDLTEEEEALLDRYLSSGTYGTTQNAVWYRMGRMARDGGASTGALRLRYCLERLFMSRSVCKEHYPFVYKHPWTMPFFWIWRLFYRGILSRKQIRRELSAVKSYAPEKKGTEA